MKILVVCQYYHPEPVRITDMCKELLLRGHSVTVLTGIPNYPMGKIYPGYKNSRIKNEIIDGVHVIRCKTIPRRKSIFYRLLNYFSFALSALREIDSLDDDYDVVFINQQSPIMMSWPGIKYAHRHHKKLLMYCMDLWPASLTVGGIRPNSLIYKLFFAISKKIYRQMDTILGTSRMFGDYLHRNFEIPLNKLEYLPQYSETIFDDVTSLDNGKTDLMFAGNIGTAQNVDVIINAARILQNRNDIIWHIVGDGVELENIKTLSSGLTNVIFHGRKPLDEMPDLYSLADCMLVTLIDDYDLSLTLPGKVQTYMEAGKPIIAAANGETAHIIEDAHCGFCVPAGDSKKLAEAVLKFVENKAATNYGCNAKKYCLENFNKDSFFDILEKHLKNHEG